MPDLSVAVNALPGVEDVAVVAMRKMGANVHRLIFADAATGIYARLQGNLSEVTEDG
jgi:hypothetical protein